MKSDAGIKKLISKIDRKDASDFLHNEVFDQKESESSSEARSIIHGGTEAMVLYLIERGYTLKYIREICEL